MKLNNSLMAFMVGVVLFASPRLKGASRTANTHRTHGPHAVSSPSHRHSLSKTSRKLKAFRKSRKPARPNAYQRLAKMQMDPGRVNAIQKALSDAGAYHGSPTGRWDSDTREAMARYQVQNGFAVTGLPDAKSLMKLGLGPHPLPAELDKSRVAHLQPTPASPRSAESTSPSETSQDGSTAPGPEPVAPPQM